MDWLRETLSSPFGGFLAGPARTDSVGGEGLQGMGATTVSTFVPGVEGQDPASFAGSGCTRVPISPCLGTHLAGPVHSLKLDRAKTKAQADSSPAAEDEQGGPSLVDDE